MQKHLAKFRQAQTAANFKVGDTVKRRIKGETRVFIVNWVSKCGELIATEYNGYHNAYDRASGYLLVAK